MDPLSFIEAQLASEAKAKRERENLRDYFAVNAMQGLIASPRGTPNGEDATTDYYAKMAYLMADAMLAEREK